MTYEMRVGVGHSERRSPAAAVEEAVMDAKRALVGSTAHTLLVFATTGYDMQAVVGELRARAGRANIIGCSGEGIIFEDAAVETDFALGVMAFAGDDVTLVPFIEEGYGDRPVETGLALGERVASFSNASSDLRGGAPLCLMLFTDGLSGDCTAFLDALSTRLPKDLTVVGGSAGDAMRLTATYQWAEDKLVSRGVAAVLVYGKGKVETAVSHGCSAVGRALTVTQADHGWIETLDHRAAWDVFKQYLDGDPAELTADAIAHLCIGRTLGTGSLDVIRSPMQHRKEDGALFFPGGSIKRGDTIHIVRRDAEVMAEHAERTAETLRARGRGKAPSFVLQFDCCGRGKMMLGSRVAESLVTPLQRRLGGVPWLGFHGYGEIAPAAGHPSFHNYTVVLLAYFSEGDPS